MIVVGLDLSLTSTGICVIDYGVTSVDRIRPKSKGHERLQQLVARVEDRTAGIGAQLAVVEGPSFGSKGSASHQLAGLWWLVTQRLWECQVPYVVVTPQSRAMYATGRGNAGKDEVLAAVVRRYTDVDVRGNDEADALVLAAMGVRRHGAPIDDLPQTHLRAMNNVDWTDHGEAV